MVVPDNNCSHKILPKNLVAEIEKKIIFRNFFLRWFSYQDIPNPEESGFFFKIAELVSLR